MAVKAFKAYLTYYDVARELSPSDQGKYWCAIMAYMFEDEDREDKLSKMARMAFKAVKGNLKRSKSNKRGECIGDESGKNRGEVPEAENALSLSLSSSLSSKGVGAGSGSGEPAPPQSLAQTVSMSCPECGSVTDAVLHDSMSKYSVQCPCGFDAMLTPKAVEIAASRQAPDSAGAQGTDDEAQRKVAS